MDVDLEACTASVRDGRRWVVARAREHDLPESTLGVLELLTSELVTNAVRHGPTPSTITLTFEAGARAVDVVVTDASTTPPLERDPDPHETGGRGIQLVHRLAQEWGVRVHPGRGKSVWFRLHSGRAVAAPAARRSAPRTRPSRLVPLAAAAPATA